MTSSVDEPSSVNRHEQVRGVAERPERAVGSQSESAPSRAQGPLDFVVIAGLVYAALWSISWAVSSGVLGENVVDGLAVDRAALYFGEVWEQDAFEWSIPIRNTTDAPVRIVAIEASCGCKSFSPKQLEIPPHGESQLRLTLNLTLNDSTVKPSSASPFAVQVTTYVQANDLVSRVWTIRGRVRDVLGFPNDIQFGGAERLVQGAVFASKSVQVSAFVPLAELKAHCDASLAAVGVRRLDERGHEFSVVVTPSKALKPGPFAFPLRLSPVLQDGSSLPSLSLRVHGFVEQDMRATPDAVSFVGAVGATAPSQAVALHSFSGQDFDVTDITVSPTQPPIQIRQATPQDSSQRRSFVVSPNNIFRGDRRQEITFFVRTSSGNREKIVVPVCTYGQDLQQNRLGAVPATRNQEATHQ